MIEIKTDEAPKAVGPYSQAVMDGRMIFASGQIHVGKDGKLLEGTIEEQTKQVMANVEAVLKAAGSGLKDVVKATIYVTDMSMYGRINAVYSTYFSHPFPARELVCVKELPLGAKVEISVVAMKATEK